MFRVHATSRFLVSALNCITAQLSDPESWSCLLPHPQFWAFYWRDHTCAFEPEVVRPFKHVGTSQCAAHSSIFFPDVDEQWNVTGMERRR